MSPLHLKKFFSLAFGNIFEDGVAVDPEFFLPEGTDAAAPMPFDICGEEHVTIVVGWDPDVARLDLRVTTPSGKVIQGGSPGVEQSTGRSWTFLRFDLPYDGERDGQWKLQVFRARESRPVNVNYFVNVIVEGGPRLELMPVGRKFYTGDTINPLVALKYRDGAHPHHAKVEVEVSIPDAGVGNILTSARLREPITVGADTVPARQATLLAVEAETRKPAVGFTQQSFQLFDDPGNTNGFEPSGIFGKPLADLLKTEGNYTFHFKAVFGEECTATRELFWTLHVDAGIDPTQTNLSATILSTQPDGKRLVRIDIIPRDKFGNHLGPGRLNALSIDGIAGTTVKERPQDNRDGSYSVLVIWDSTISPSPGVIVSQPHRPPVVLQESGGGQTVLVPVGDQKTPTWCWVLLVLFIILLLCLMCLLWLILF